MGVKRTKKNERRVVVNAAYLELQETKADVADGIVQGNAKEFEFHITEDEVEKMFVDAVKIQKMIPDTIEASVSIALEDEIDHLLGEPPTWLAKLLKTHGWAPSGK